MQSAEFLLNMAQGMRAQFTHSVTIFPGDAGTIYTFRYNLPVDEDEQDIAKDV
jgi:hypothetical protein